ncbi:MAG: hypothetical protein KatS3mg110_2729 [Pirellulaceae bacterium]|nr:MAG: hypothetical protein KatS3mg110_2729 [Pirellulaceae bacterium]
MPQLGHLVSGGQRAAVEAVGACAAPNDRPAYAEERYERRSASRPTISRDAPFRAPSSNDNRHVPRSTDPDMHVSSGRLPYSSASLSGNPRTNPLDIGPANGSWAALRNHQASTGHIGDKALAAGMGKDPRRIADTLRKKLPNDVSAERNAILVVLHHGGECAVRINLPGQPAPHGSDRGAVLKPFEVQGIPLFPITAISTFLARTNSFASAIRSKASGERAEWSSAAKPCDPPPPNAVRSLRTRW